MAKSKFIELKKVATNNLDHININFPLEKITVVTGVSGSGKSSLVFDTLYAESYRRYVESLSSFARQYIKTMPKPPMAEALNLPASVAVRQTRQGANNRSTVGTLTEINDLVQTLFAYGSGIFCSRCQNKEVRTYTGSQVYGELLSQKLGRVTILAPLSQWQNLKDKKLKEEMALQGFSRYWQKDLGFFKESDKCFSQTQIHQCSVVLDRIDFSSQNKNRLIESFDLGLKLSKGYVQVLDSKENILSFSSLSLCQSCGTSYEKPSKPRFSFNHPLGACALCEGFGKESQIDWDKVFPDKDLSIKDEGIKALNFGSHREYYKYIKKSAKAQGWPLDMPFKKYTKKQWQWLKEGDDSGFGGLNDYFAWLQKKSYKPHYRMHYAKFRTYITCSSCGGSRYRKETQCYQVNQKNIIEVLGLSIESFIEWLDNFFQKSQKQQVGRDLETYIQEALQSSYEQARWRASYLIKIGLKYLTLDRVSTTLSGGELQRINMARCLGSSLTETLFCLDEPTAGLHVRDSKRLFHVMEELKSQGNTVVVVEHEKTIIDLADQLVEIGPGAGHQGGMITYQGLPKTLDSAPLKALPFNKKAKEDLTNFLCLEDANTQNLKNISVKIPLGAITTVCGVSGSGKTSLIQQTLYPLLYEKVHKKSLEDYSPQAKKIGPLKALRSIQEVHFVSQAPIGRSSRSNIVTYLGVYEAIRKILASTEQAKKRGLTPKEFSFNSPGGRCENCKGLGTLMEDLSFLGEQQVVCPVCEGKRFGQEVLGVTYRDFNLLKILSLTVQEARELFFQVKKICKILDTVIALGLGYMRLGQPVSSFSGGEAQRLKLLNFALTRQGQDKCLFIFDEPTTGLSDQDVRKLWEHFCHLREEGHTIVIVEHHLDVIRQSDWLLEMGPEAAHKGGQLIFEGPPMLLKKKKNSPTGLFL